MKQRCSVITLLLFIGGVAPYASAQSIQPQQPSPVTPMPAPAQSQMPAPVSSQFPSAPTPSQLPSPATQMPPPTQQVTTQTVLPAAANPTPPQVEMSTHQESRVQGTSGAAEKQTVVDVGGNLKIVPKTPASTTTTGQSVTTTSTPSQTTTPASVNTTTKPVVPVRRMPRGINTLPTPVQSP